MSVKKTSCKIVYVLVLYIVKNLMNIESNNIHFDMKSQKLTRSTVEQLN